MTYSVRYGRYGGVHTETFDTFEEAEQFINTSEDRGEIWAVSVADDNGILWNSRHPLDPLGRWEKVRQDAPDFAANLIS